jgi:hypothetical protein
MKYVGIALVVLVIAGVLYWLNSGGYYTDQPKPKKNFKIKFHSKDAVFGILGGMLIGSLFAAMMIVPLKMHQNELNDKRVWLNEDHTACHYQDTVVVNDQKYIHVWDKSNSGFYGDPYLVPVNN